MSAAPPPGRPHRRWAVLVGSSALLVALVVAGVVWAGRGHDPAPAAAPAPSASTPVTPSSSAPLPSPTVTTRRPPRARHDHVAAAAPTRFVFRQRAHHRFTIRARVCGMEYVRPLDPPGEQHHTVCWVRHDFGFAPGSSGRGTTYVLGHAWGQDPQEVLNPISETAMRQALPRIRRGASTPLAGIPTYPVTRLDGAVVTLRTRAGVLQYTVRDAYLVAKAEAGNVRPLMAQHTRNRVVIITCGELNHVDYDFNVIIEAYLTSSTHGPQSVR